MNIVNDEANLQRYSSVASRILNPVFDQNSSENLLSAYGTFLSGLAYRLLQVPVITVKSDFLSWHYREK